MWQVFEGTGTLTMNGQEYQLRRGDVIAVPAWTEFDVKAADALDFFAFSDAPVFEKLNLLRTEVTG